MESECPIDGCDYTGDADSVEAHVSSVTDEGHKGLTGRTVRGQIEEANEPVPEDDGGTAPAGAGLGAAAVGAGTMMGAEGDGLSTVELAVAVAFVLVMLYLLASSSASGGSRTDSEEDRGDRFGGMA
jgi:hypothetical protein